MRIDSMGMGEAWRQAKATSENSRKSDNFKSGLDRMKDVECGTWAKIRG